jgi:oligopeptide transport system permease protein
MLRFILRRLLLETLPTLFALVTLTFFLVRLAPGGPFTQEKGMSEEVLARLNAHYGLDRPLPVQYLRYLGNLVQGDLGPSFRYAATGVNELIARAFPVSLELGMWALFYSLVVGVGAGLLAALRPRRWPDHLAMGFAMTGVCVPSMVLGPLLAIVFALNLGWVDVAGWDDWRDRILPTVALGTAYAAYLARLTRAGMLDVLNQDFIRTARAKGLSESRVILVHALRGGVLPVVSFLGPAVAGLITGSFVIESVFQIPGLGQVIVNAAFNRDYFVIMGTVLFFGVLLILLNLVSDVLTAWLNPRLRQSP